MSAETYIDFWGVLAALSFAGMMGAFLWRMIKISSPFRIVVPRVPGSPQRILVPISDILYAERGIDLARRLRGNLETEIRLLHVIEVPMTLPLEASLPQEETKAREILRRGESLANLWGLKIASEIKRGRLASEEIIRTAEDWGADMIVMSVQLRTRLWRKIFGRTSERVRRKGPCEVLLDEFSPGRLIEGRKPLATNKFLIRTSQAGGPRSKFGFNVDRIATPGLSPSSVVQV